MVVTINIHECLIECACASITMTTFCFKNAQQLVGKMVTVHEGVNRVLHS